MDGVDPVHCTRGTCNLNKLVGVLLIHKVMYQACVFTNCHLKLVKEWEVSEELLYVSIMMNSLYL